MDTNYLLPNRYKNIGWMIFIPSVIIGLVWLGTEYELSFLNLPALALVDVNIFGNNEVHFFAIEKNNYTNELIAILLIIGGLMVAFSKEPAEDEFIKHVRMESLIWAIKANYIILFFTLLFLFDDMFLRVMMVNLYTVLLLFIIRFNLKIRESKK